LLVAVNGGQASALGRRLYLCVATLLVPLAVGAGCVRYESPETASNQLIHTGQKVRSGDYGEVYRQLCAVRRAEVSEAEFVNTAGDDASGLFATRSWNGQDSYEDPRDIETLNPDVVEASRVIRIQRPTGPAPMDFDYEFWQVVLEREDGLWKLCRYQRLEVVAPESDQTRCDRDPRRSGCASYEFDGTTIPMGT